MCFQTTYVIQVVTGSILLFKCKAPVYKLMITSYNTVVRNFLPEETSSQ